MISENKEVFSVVISGLLGPVVGSSHEDLAVDDAELVVHEVGQPPALHAVLSVLHELEVGARLVFQVVDVVDLPLLTFARVLGRFCMTSSYL